MSLWKQPTDLARINAAFFEMNALVGLILVIGVALSIYWPNPLVGFYAQPIYTEISAKGAQT